MITLHEQVETSLRSPRSEQILDALTRGEEPKPGPQVDRQTSCPEGGPSTLKKMSERNYDYRSQWNAAPAPGEIAQ